MLKFETDNVPAELAQYYEEAGDGKYRLKIEGAVAASELVETKRKLEEFRNNNRELHNRTKKLEQFETVFKGADLSPEKLTEHIESLALTRASEMKQAYETQVQQLTEELSAERGRLEQIVLSDSVKSAAMKHGVSETAVEDVLARAKQAFKVEQGQLLAADANLDAKGQKVTLESWMSGLATAAPHLFTASRGAGAQKTGRPVVSEKPMSAADKISVALAKRR